MSVFVKAPKFWSKPHHPLSYMLAPLGFFYGLGVQARFALTNPYRSTLPIICIGNFTMGGGGKTPLVLEIARLLYERGYKPAFLTRGYGGQTKGPHLVDLTKDRAAMVGDEPLVLALSAPVVVCSDRKKGARFIEQMDEQVDVILMDDGFQNPTLHKDLSVIVVDEVAGIGNGHIFPAGPLRASLSFQRPRADILVVAGPDIGDVSGSAKQVEERYSGVVLRSDLEAVGDVSWLQGARILAVTGIARPEKFYGSLRRLGARIVETSDFPDHHYFTEREARDILSAARNDDTQIVMTQKDWVRLPEKGERGHLRECARVLHVGVKIDEPQKLMAALEKAIASAAQDSD